MTFCWHLGSVSHYLVETVEELARLLYPGLAEANDDTSSSSAVEPAA